MRIVEFTEEFFSQVRCVANLSLHEDTITDGSLRRITFGDPNYSSKYSLVAVKNGEVAGFLLAVRRLKEPPEVVEAQKDLAWIKLFAVREDCRRRGIATALFNELENRLKEDGVKRIRISDYPFWYLFSGVDLKYEDAIDFLSRRGFRKAGETVDYEIDLLKFHVPKRLASMSVSPLTIRRARHEDRENVFKWIKTEFSIFWAYEADASFKHASPKLWMAEENDRIIGFSVYGALEPHWFGPIGVLTEARSKGIGSILLFNCLKSMREEGQRHAVVPWTNHLFFYTQVPGITRIRHYWIMEKTLS
ncbi:MAG: GNAT family N-acetyltransferase [Candidatus Brockarchaeota archaeon]|nr:GNAT family N-acetyltransferase [Candidatus Brockarchaeota archaeon]MBO3832585.1 GNAT family N-acetyltransferase [Candidatus Brockarchaeota archaeon]